MGLVAGIHGDDNMTARLLARKTSGWKYQKIKRGNGKGLLDAPSASW